MSPCACEEAQLFPQDCWSVLVISSCVCACVAFRGSVCVCVCNTCVPRSMHEVQFLDMSICLPGAEGPSLAPQPTKTASDRA